MKKRIAILLIFFIGSTLLTGCWNYREIEGLSIVAGAAIDKEEDGYLLNVEIIDIKAGKETNKESKIIESRGKTIFDAIRNVVQISGRKLYWSHAKVIIISQEIAKKGISEVLDFFMRDSELRPNLEIIVSKEKTARELFKMESVSEDIKSYEMSKTLSNQTSVLKAPQIPLYQLINDLAAEGKSAVLPTITLISNDDKIRYQLSGTAVFKKDKLIGFLEGKETKQLFFILNLDKGGLLVGDEIAKEEESGITLEVFQDRSVTKVKPIYKNDDIAIKLTIYIAVAIAENSKLKDLSSDEAVEQFRKQAQDAMTQEIEELIEKVQAEYGSDIFGFGNTVKSNMPKAWKQVKNKWDEMFKTLDVQVDVNLHILNKSRVYKPFEIGD